jgi:hypothetical protein
MLMAMYHVNHESAAFWATIVGTFLSVASMLVSIVALSVARSSLALASQVAEQEQIDWKQRKWFDLYFGASEFYSHLERYQTVYEHRQLRTEDDVKDWNEMMFLIRRVQAMAVVFPKTAAIDEFIAATSVFSDQREAFSKERLKIIFDAVYNLGKKAAVHSSVLE